MGAWPFRTAGPGRPRPVGWRVCGGRSLDIVRSVYSVTNIRTRIYGCNYDCRRAYPLVHGLLLRQEFLGYGLFQQLGREQALVHDEVVVGLYVELLAQSQFSLGAQG